jgi:hypothetical protein
MDAIEFLSNYEKYLGELRSVVRPELFPVIKELESKKPNDLVSIDRNFASENDARGYVWSLFVDGANKFAYQNITIDIDDIKTLDDIEMFFILLEKEHISYSPECSFSEIVNSDLDGNTTVPTFTTEESERLDMLMGKCRDLVDELDVNIFKISKRANLIVRGKNEWNQSPSEEY